MDDLVYCSFDEALKWTIVGPTIARDLVIEAQGVDSIDVKGILGSISRILRNLEYGKAYLVELPSSPQMTSSYALFADELAWATISRLLDSSSKCTIEEFLQRIDGISPEDTTQHVESTKSYSAVV